MTVSQNLPMPRPAEGRLDGPLHRFALRAHFEDTDLSGVVYHANYLRWFERARSDLLRQLGIDQRAAHEAGEGAYVVSEVQIRYIAPARLDDDVVIETQAEELGAVSSRLLQRAFRLPPGDDAAVLLSEMRVRVGFLGPDGRPRRQPAGWRDAFTSFQSATPES